jgi:vitamin K-dependent gamma-carboxylase
MNVAAMEVADISNRIAKDSWNPWRTIDGASIYFFRFAFGLVIAWWSWDYVTSGRVTYLYVEPKVHFTYPWLDWVKPLPSPAIYVHFIAIAILGLCVAFGFFYRYASFALAILFTYFFLLERANYQNHYYLISLLCWLMAFFPLGKAASFDCTLFRLPSDYSLSIGNLWALRWAVGIPYFYGGIAKLSSDWFAGCPLRQTLRQHGEWPIIGSVLTSEWTVQLLIWGGLLFDLCIVPLLLVSRTRTIAFFLCVGFHLANAVLFRIHVFPWLMLLATTLFFAPNWPRVWLGGAEIKFDAIETKTIRFKPAWVAVSIAALAIQLLVPLRHWLVRGDVNWTEQGHVCSWRMMLRGKVSVVRFYLTDKLVEKTTIPTLRQYINADQLSRMAMDPLMIRQMGMHLENEFRETHHRPVEVRALALSSLNGRKPELLVDPEMDISSESRDFSMTSWIRPMTEPLPKEPWDVPIDEWSQKLDLPKLSFLK